MSEPRTHYQISLTARQAVGLFAGLLVALGLAFFFGLMAGLPGRDAKGAEKVAESRASAEKTPAAGFEPMPPVETGVAPGPLGGASKNETAVLTPAPVEPTAPATLHPFEDSADEEAAAAPAPGSRTLVVGSGPAAQPAKASAPATKSGASTPKAAASGRIWVQAASLSSHEEATALGARLSKHGFHAVVLAGAAPKGKVYRVRVGPYHSEEEASRAVSKLAKQEKIREPWIVAEGK